MSAGVVCLPEELTSAWLTEALGRPVELVSVETVGTGQIGACYRLLLTDGTLLAKLPAADVGMRGMLVGAYRGEVSFYAELAATVAVRVPACHYATMRPDSGDFTLLLDDLAPAQQGDQIAGCTPQEARAAVVNLAGLHGPRWCDPTLTRLEGFKLNEPEDAAMLAEFHAPATDTFVELLSDRLDVDDVHTLQECVSACEAWVNARPERYALVHGDYRLDNLMFLRDGADVRVWALDWQTLSLALPARDLAYFLGTGLVSEDRRACERELVAAYHSALVGHGVTGYDLDQCWDDYCFSMLQGPLIATMGFAYGTRTERGDQMFAVMAQRACAAIRDLGTLRLAAG